MQKGVPLYVLHAASQDTNRCSALVFSAPNYYNSTMPIFFSIYQLLVLPSLRQMLGLSAFVSAAILAGALAGQYWLGWFPCELCLYQRYPYVAVIILAILVWRMAPARQRHALAAIAVLLAGNSGLAFYHAGVEYGWFTGPSACSSPAGGAQSLEELRAQIIGAPLVSCSQALAYVLGLSLAVWNVIISGIFSLFLTVHLIRGRNGER